MVSFPLYGAIIQLPIEMLIRAKEEIADLSGFILWNPDAAFGTVDERNALFGSMRGDPGPPTDV